MAELMKDAFDASHINALSKEIAKVHKDFPAKRFKKLTTSGRDWKALEMKERMRRISDSLAECLPDDYEKAVTVLVAACRPFSGLQALVFPDFVEVYGRKYWKTSMKALAVFTELCSSEFGIRPFIEQDPDLAFRQLKLWSESENEHLRRLASEGCRPFLPWGNRIAWLNENPDRIIQILDTLKADRSLYVRKSVANNLNDLSKIDADKVLVLAESWRGACEETNWIVKHALRTLLKKAEPRALALFDYRDPADFLLKGFRIRQKTISIGDEIQFGFCLESRSGPLGKLRIEYVIAYVK
ncbi:MAG: DNA alkylation repair protein, partial [Verrucomicrobiota bacterium]